MMTGRVPQRGDGLMVSVELVDTRDNSQIWGEQYDRKLTDLVATQRDISREVFEKLRVKLTRGRKEPSGEALHNQQRGLPTLLAWPLPLGSQVGVGDQKLSSIFRRPP